MAFGMFRMMFAASGNAVPVLQQMTGASRELVVASASVAQSLANQSQILSRNATMAEKADSTFVGLTSRMANLARTGQITSSTLINLAKSMEVLENLSTQSAARVRNFSNQLLVMASDLKTAEQAARQAGSPKGGFQMMKDVSEESANKMRMVSSAAQGTMISMALLQRNVTGLAFSLIFLQFSGFLKLSLAIAGVTALLGGSILGFRALVKEGKRIKDLNDQLFIMTGGLESGALAFEAAQITAEKFGLAVKPFEEVQFASILKGVELVNKDMNIFGEALSLVKAGVTDIADNKDELIQAFVAWKDPAQDASDEINTFFESLKTGTGEAQEQFDRLSHTELGQDIRMSGDVRRAFDDATRETAVGTATIWGNIKAGWMIFSTGFFQLFSDDWKTGLNNMKDVVANSLGFKVLSTLFIDPFTNTFTHMEQALSAFTEGDWKEGFKQLLKSAKDILFAPLLGLGWVGEKIVTSIWDGITSVWDKIFGNSWWSDNLEALLEHTKSILLSPFTGVFRIGKDIVLDMWDGIKVIWDFIFGGNQWSNKIENITSSLRGVLFDQFDGVFNIGRNIVSGLWDGIQSLWGWLQNKTFSFGSMIHDQVKRGLGTLWPLSPSVAGVKIGEGLIAGINKGIMGPSGRSNNISISVNVHGAFSNDPRQAANSTASQVLKGITRNGSFSGAGLVA